MKYHVIYTTPTGQTVDITDTGNSAKAVADKHRPSSNGGIVVWPVTERR